MVTVTLKWYRTSVEGEQVHFTTTKLADATIMDIDCSQDLSKREYTQLIQVSLSYRKIDWEHTVAGTLGSNEWRAPVKA